MFIFIILVRMESFLEITNVMMVISFTQVVLGVAVLPFFTRIQVFSPTDTIFFYFILMFHILCFDPELAAVHLVNFNSLNKEEHIFHFHLY